MVAACCQGQMSKRQSKEITLQTFRRAVRQFGRLDCTRIGHLIRERARRRLRHQQHLMQRQAAQYGRMTTITHNEPWY